jgi:hypothetical protein
MKISSFQLDDGTTVPVILISPAELDDALGAADAADVAAEADLQKAEPVAS